MHLRLVTAVSLIAVTAPRLAAQALPADSIPRGAVIGAVLDAETGEALPGAVVVLEPAPGGAITPAHGGSAFWTRGRSAMTNPAGRYRFDDVPPGMYRLLVRRLGYRPALLELDIRRAGPFRVSVGLEVRPVLLEPEQVSAPAVLFAGMGAADEENRGARLDLELHRQRTYPATDVRMLTGSDVAEAVTLGETDLFRAFQRLPGITTRDDFTAALWTRGAPWSHTRVTFDGLPLFNPLHTVGVFSGLNPDAVGSVVLHPGVRSAALGEGAAAALEIGSRSSPRDFEGTAELSVVSARSALAVGGERAGGVLAARRSYVDLVTRAFADSAAAIPYAFFDITARADVRLGSATVLEASALWERDDVRGTVRDLLRNTRGFWGNAAGRVSLVAPIGPLFTRHTIGASRFAGRLRLTGFAERDTGGVAPAHQPTDNMLSYVTVSSRVEPPSGAWALGAELAVQRQDYVGPPPRPYPQARLEDTLLLAATLSVPAVWGEVRLDPGALRIVAGVRVEGITGVAHATSPAVAPRIVVRWAPDQRTALSAGYGRSYQYTQAAAPAGPGVGPELHLTDVWLLAGDSVPAIRSDVVTGGVETWLGGAWLGALNVYGREATGVAEPWPEPGQLRADRRLFAPATHRAAGVEVSVRRLAGRWTASAAYSLGVSRVTAPAAGRVWRYPAATDRRHVFDATAMVRLGRAWRVGGAFTAASGAPYTRFIASAVVCDSAATVVCEGAVGDTLGIVAQAIETPGAERARGYATLDLLAEWSHDLGRWSLGAWVQLRNVLNARNAVTYVGSFDRCEDGDDIARQGVCDWFDRGLPFLPLAGVRVAF